MQVIKRNGKSEEVKFDKILQRVKALSKDLQIEPVLVSQKVVAGLYDNMTTTQIDSLLAETSASLTTDHYDYMKLAARISVSSLHKETSNFYQTMKLLYKEGYISEDLISDIRSLGQENLDSIIDYNRDFMFDYFGFKTLERSYLLKVNKVPVERPQHMFMRVAIGICGANLAEVKELYDLMSQGYYTHATPTLFNAGTKRPQMSSCFLIAMEDDSIEGIYNTLKEAALISKSAGGVGLHIHNIRANGSLIRGTNGASNGIVPMLRVFNETMRYVDQGGGKRKGSAAIYLEPWHKDVEAFLHLKRNQGDENLRCRDLFLALWTPDLFMKRVDADAHWTLFCPTEAPGLADVWGDAFEKLYEKYESEGKGIKIKARDLMLKILESMAESGVPYILFKDACNAKSNQQNLGTIKSSNLCTEIIEYSDATETAVCNLASLSLPRFVYTYTNGQVTQKFDFDKLHDVAKIAIKNLNRVIDRNFYPTAKTKKSNMRHRPLSLGVQGLADVFMMMGLPFESEEAKQLNKDIAETIYHAALEASCDLVPMFGKYETFTGSPLSKGKFQFDLWNVKPSERYDWEALRARVVAEGVCNSLLVGLMPTATTSQIFGNFESIDPAQTNLFKRQTLSGEFVVINKHLVNDLVKVQLWTKPIRDKIVAENGSVQNIPEIPTAIKEVYKTVWEIPQKVVVDMALGRGPYICQAQSMNLFFADPNFGRMSSALMYAWKNGAKNGVYYTRTRSAVQAQKVTTAIEHKPIEALPIVQAPVVDQQIQESAMVCSLDNPDECVVCSS